MNESTPGPASDAALRSTRAPTETTIHLAYAEASFLLIECLMLVFVERGIFTVDELLGEIGTALATKQQMVEEGAHVEISTIAAGMLASMGNSLAAVSRVKRATDIG
jgi:hypothetical protein